MKRLTEKDVSGKYFYPKCFEKCDGLGASSKCDNCELTTNVYEKLGKYEDLEEQGCLIKLPCKIGETVYYINPNENTIKKLVVYSFDIRPLQHFVCDYMGARLNFNQFGKTVFLTKSEAESKLKELSNN